MKILSRARLTVAVVGAAGVASLGLFVGQAAHAQRASTSTTGGDTSVPDGTSSSATAPVGAGSGPASATSKSSAATQRGSAGKVSTKSGSSGNGGSHGS